MKKESLEKDSLSNVVEFPGKVKVGNTNSLSLGNDPIEELLNEFKDFEFNEDFEDWEDFEVDDMLFEDYVIEAPENSCQSIEVLKQQIEALGEVSSRMKYYISEINTHRHRF